jgi:hypothetical protein
MALPKVNPPLTDVNDWVKVVSEPPIIASFSCQVTPELNPIFHPESVL